MTSPRPAYESLLAIARGDRPADLLLRGGTLVHVHTGELERTDVAIFGNHIAAVGEGYSAEEVHDIEGQFLVPGFIDAHVHVESSMVTPREMARAVVPRGVTTVVTDPHEIANVLGLDGIRFMLDDGEGALFDMFVNASSCVPATHLGSAGATLEAEELSELLTESWVLGLAEVMNFPGVVHGDGAVRAKLDAFAGRVIDGHCPGLSGKELNAYVAAGIHSDHECTTVEEASEKLRRGLTIFLREATNAHNLRDLLPVVTAANERRCCFCTDDREPPDLLELGSIDHLLRLAIEDGLDPILAIRLATINPAEYFRLWDRGIVAPGRLADLAVLSDLRQPRVLRVYRRGRQVAADGELLSEPPPSSVQAPVGTVHIDRDALDFRIEAQGSSIRVIGAIPDQLITESLVLPARVEDGEAVADPASDVLKMAVIERHRATGRIGLGFVRGIGLEQGALASTVAHDHHNLVVIGADDRSMRTAARAVAEAGGGQAVALGDDVLGLLPLPIAGLMSDRPIEEVAAKMHELVAHAHRLGSKLHAPFMAMSFLALEVIPNLKLTDLGLVDVGRFETVPIFTD